MSQSISFANCSFSAITNHTQANQWATSEKHSINNVKIIAVYCEYRSIFCKSLANRRSLVNFTKCMCDSCEGREIIQLIFKPNLNEEGTVFAENSLNPKSWLLRNRQNFIFAFFSLCILQVLTSPL